MRSKTGKIINNIALYIILVALGCGIACASLIFFMVDGFVNQFGNGLLKAVFVTIYLCAIAATIAIGKKKKSRFSAPALSDDRRAFGVYGQRDNLQRGGTLFFRIQQRKMGRKRGDPLLYDRRSRKEIRFCRYDRGRSD